MRERDARAAIAANPAQIRLYVKTIVAQLTQSPGTSRRICKAARRDEGIDLGGGVLRGESGTGGGLAARCKAAVAQVRLGAKEMTYWRSQAPPERTERNRAGIAGPISIFLRTASTPSVATSGNFASAQEPLFLLFGLFGRHDHSPL